MSRNVEHEYTRIGLLVARDRVHISTPHTDDRGDRLSTETQDTRMPQGTCLYGVQAFLKNEAAAN